MKLWTLAMPLLALAACKDGAKDPDDTDTTPPEPEETADTVLPPSIENYSREIYFGYDPELQQAVASAWGKVTTGNLGELGDFDAYQENFLRLFGFGLDGVDYGADTDPVRELAG